MRKVAGNIMQHCELSKKGRLIIGVLIIQATFWNQACAQETSVEVTPKWKKGEKQQFEMFKSRKRTRNGKLTFDGTSRTDLTIEVVDINAKLMLVSWRLGETSFDDPKLKSNQLLKAMSNIYKDQAFILEMDLDGEIRGIRNWKEVRDWALKSLDISLNELKRSGLPTTALAQIRNQIDSMATTKEQMTQLSIREAQPFFMLLGMSISTDKPIEYEDRLPNPFGGESFPSKGRFVLKSKNDDQKIALLQWSQSIDPEKAAKLLDQTLRRLNQQFGNSGSAKESLKSISIMDSADFEVELTTGWNRAFTLTRLVKTGQDSQEDTTRIIRKNLK